MRTGKWRASAQTIALILGVVAGYAVPSTTAQAAVIYKTSGDLVIGIGDQLNSLFDKISLGPYESTFVAPETKGLNPLTFVIGFNSNAPATADGHLTETITIGATTEPVTIPFVATISASGDSLSVLSTTFVVGRFQFVTLPLIFVNVGSVSSSETQFLEANISLAAVPEPGAWMLMLVGIGGIGLVSRRARGAPSSSRRRSAARAGAING
jgi:PEP-CTERM motif